MPKKLLPFVDRPERPRSLSSSACAIVTEAGTPVLRWLLMASAAIRSRNASPVLGSAAAVALTAPRWSVGLLTGLWETGDIDMGTSLFSRN
jgi:hypothetical protein